MQPDKLRYITQPGDSLKALAARFGVEAGQIESAAGDRDFLAGGFIDPGTMLLIPNSMEESTTRGGWLLPDGEIIFSPTAADFDTQEFVNLQESFFREHIAREFSGLPDTAANVLDRVALENSVNPRLLLALLEYQCGCVMGFPANEVSGEYLMGYEDWREAGLYNQLVWAAAQLQKGYYGWRSGSLTAIRFQDGEEVRLHPELNAGTAALYYFFAQLYPLDAWLQTLDSESGFPALYWQMFGDPWARAEKAGPLFPSGLEQPPLELPFLPGHTWSFSGGPHSAWEKDGPRAALDFTPLSEGISCVASDEWVAAAASGLVVRAGNGVVVQDLDGDGSEQTGWVLVYVHIEQAGNIPVGTRLEKDTLIGHPSCEGGPSSSAHLHIARKYNGEWMLAGGAIPFNLGGWVAAELPEYYRGTLTKDGITITSCTCTTANTNIKRPRDE
jgi:murein DD-endopeptidase MepM/ murein hydrolase activator NlpD